MNALTSSLPAQARSEMYAGLAQAFRFPSPDQESPLLSAQDYTQAFYPSVSDDACGLHEVGYAGAEQSALFEELARFYRFFGLSRSEQAELPDHITVELEFMHYLTHLEAQAEQGGGDVTSLRAAQADFLSRHLWRFVCGLAHKMGAGVPEPCRQLVNTSVEFIRSEMTALGMVSLEQVEEE